MAYLQHLGQYYKDLCPIVKAALITYSCFLQVPKYLSQQWAKASGRGEVGKIRICKYVVINKMAEFSLSVMV